LYCIKNSSFLIGKSATFTYGNICFLMRILQRFSQPPAPHAQTC
jgi:hypothetical protein